MISDDRIAQWIGAHATSSFGAILVALLALLIVGWLALGRFERRGRPAPLPPARVMLLRTGLGFAIVLAGGAAFAELAEALGVGARLGRFDSALAAALRHNLAPGVLQFFALATRLGNVSTLTVLCVGVGVLLLVLSHRRLALAWVLAVAGNGLLNRLLKATFERVRPLHDHELIVATGWSFPSGHSSGSVVAYGMLAYVVAQFVPPRWQLPLLLLAATLALTVGFSRVFLQVHFLSDVLAGFASGLLWLTVCITSSQWLRGRAAQLRS